MSAKRKIFFFSLLATFIVGAFTLAIFYFSLQQVLAQTDTYGLEYATATGLGTTDIRITVARIVQVFLGFLGIIALALVLYGGFLWMTSGGNAEKITKAKKLLVNGVIGLFIILASLAIVTYLISVLEGALYGPGYQGPGYGNPELPYGANFLVVTDWYPNPERPTSDMVIYSHPKNSSPKTYPQNSSVVVTFNEKLNLEQVKLADEAETCSEPTLIVEKGGEVIDGVYQIVGNSLVFQGDHDLTAEGYEHCLYQANECHPSYGNPSCCPALESGHYQVTLVGGSGGIKGQSGKELKGNQGNNFLFDFYIGEWVDNQKPKIISIAPTGGNNPMNIGVQVVFDKPINPATMLFPGDEILDPTDPTQTKTIDKTNATALIWRWGDDSDHNGECEGLDCCSQATADCVGDSGHIVPVGNVTRSTTSFVFRPNTPCVDDPSCFCFAKDSAYKIKFFGDDSPGARQIRDVSCNALDCTNSDCEHEFGVGNYIDTTPPEIHFYKKNDNGQLEEFDFKSPVDGQGPIYADRLSRIYVSLCDKYQNDPQSGCPGSIDLTTMNAYNWVMGNAVDGELLGLTLIDRQVDLCCNLHYKYDQIAYSQGCPYYNETLGSFDEQAAMCPADPAGPASLNSRMTPQLVLPPLELQSVTLYGGGTQAGTCTPIDINWGIKDLAGNGLIGNRNWAFTTSEYVNGGNPWIISIEPGSGPYDRCITIFGHNFGAIDNPDVNKPLPPGVSERKNPMIIGAGNQVVIPYSESTRYCRDPEVDLDGDRLYEYPSGATPTPQYEGCFGSVMFRNQAAIEAGQGGEYPAEILTWGPVTPGVLNQLNQIVVYVPQAVLENEPEGSGSYSQGSGTFSSWLDTEYQVTVELEP